MFGTFRRGAPGALSLSGIMSTTGSNHHRTRSCTRWAERRVREQIAQLKARPNCLAAGVLRCLRARPPCPDGPAHYDDIHRDEVLDSAVASAWPPAEQGERCATSRPTFGHARRTPSVARCAGLVRNAVSTFRWSKPSCLARTVKVARRFALPTSSPIQRARAEQVVVDNETLAYLMTFCPMSPISGGRSSAAHCTGAVGP